MPDLRLRSSRGLRGGSRLWLWAASMGAVAFALATQPSRAASITVGNKTLLPNTPNQKIQIMISGTEMVIVDDIYVQIGDGGTFNGGVNTKPVFQNVDVVTGTIFAGGNGAHPDPSNSSHPLIWVDGTSTLTGSSVQANGLLATLTVDTTGVSAGTFPLLLSGVASKFGGFTTDLIDANSTTGAPIPLTITNGSITVASPEPTSLAGVVLTGMLGLRRVRRKSRG